MPLARWHPAGFGTKHKRKEDANHLMAALQEFYEVSLGNKGRQYIGVNLDWDYSERSALCSMPGCAKQALEVSK